MGAVGAALVSMVANLTIGKKNYEAFDAELKATNAEAEKVRAELTAAIDEDVVAFVWERMEPDTFFEVEPDTNTIILNSRYREAVLQGTRGSSGDAPLVKTLLMLLCKDDMTRRNRMQTHEVKLQTFNQLLVEAVRSQW